MDIEFRGQRTDNKEWVFGYLISIDKYSFTDPDRYGIANKAIPVLFGNIVYNFEINEVDPKTVGRYTGKRDMKRTEEYPEGQKIFEGDRLDTSNSNCRFWEVVFSNGAFKAKQTNLEKGTYETPLYEFIESTAKLEVIGTIHD